MRAIIRTLLVLSLTLVFGASISYAQQVGYHVEADIPFSFSVGDKTFAAGKYDLAVIRLYGAIHAVRMRDESGKVVCNMTAIQNGSSVPKGADMLFSVADGQRYLDKLRTTDFGFVFSRSSGDKRVAKVKQVSVPAESSPN